MSNLKITTHSGVLFDLVSPCSDLVNIGDIAFGLSEIHRYDGIYGITAAQHALNVLFFVEQTAPAFMVEALLNDAADAYVCDETIRLALRAHAGTEIGFGILKAEIRRAIFDYFGLDDAPIEAVAIAERAELRREFEQFLKPETHDTVSDFPVSVNKEYIRVVSGGIAQSCFLRCFEDLMQKRQTP